MANMDIICSVELLIVSLYANPCHLGQRGWNQPLSSGPCISHYKMLDVSLQCV